MLSRGKQDWWNSHTRSTLNATQPHNPATPQPACASTRVALNRTHNPRGLCVGFSLGVNLYQPAEIEKARRAEVRGPLSRAGCGSGTTRTSARRLKQKRRAFHAERRALKIAAPFRAALCAGLERDTGADKRAHLRHGHTVRAFRAFAGTRAAWLDLAQVERESALDFAYHLTRARRADRLRAMFGPAGYLTRTIAARGLEYACALVAGCAGVRTNNGVMVAPLVEITRALSAMVSARNGAHLIPVRTGTMRTEVRPDARGPINPPRVRRAPKIKCARAAVDALRAAYQTSQHLISMSGTCETESHSRPKSIHREVRDMMRARDSRARIARESARLSAGVQPAESKAAPRA